MTCNEYVNFFCERLDKTIELGLNALLDCALASFTPQYFLRWILFILGITNLPLHIDDLLTCPMGELSEF